MVKLSVQGGVHLLRPNKEPVALIRLRDVLGMRRVYFASFPDPRCQTS
jgi:hypothetical protein